ncbi:protein phosphatase inhibitor 2 [Wyeomyia smithii]|uniref:protein phosphatase inhibitor 2 n=1 Tax=Wyeomyia smithii TaxID=174621 RepID=UPI002467F5FD|nr:protein phosphatase inhibitor 2 [Wyeomyia smithii]
MSLNTDSPDAKKPCKGILKSSSSFDKHTAAPVASSSNHRKSAKFDELNVLQTYHPADKDYGHMKVDEPKTPFNYVEELDFDQLDAELLAEKLREAVNSRGDSVSEEEAESSEEEEEEISEEQKKRKLDFERRRKAHYNEFEAIKLARKLIEEEHEDDEDDEDDASLSQAAAAAAVNSSKATEGQKMEVEELDEVDRKNGEPAPSSSRVTTGTDQADQV